MGSLDMLEQRLAAAEEALTKLREDLHLKRVALEFPRAEIRAGDHFSCSGGIGTLYLVDNDGDWNYGLNGTSWSGNGPLNPERLFTLAEVEAIVAEALSRG